MEKRFSEIMMENKAKKLFVWRDRYSKQEYPYKVAFNLLYEMLVVEKMWTEIQSSFNMSLLSFGKKKFQNFQEAHEYVVGRSNIIAKNDIIPIVDREYKTRESIACCTWSKVRNSVLKAQKGDNKAVQDIEIDYSLYTCGVELIYAWSAIGYLGLDQESAFFELAKMIIGGVDYSSYESLLHFFVQSAGIFYTYKPLPDLF